MPRRPDNLTMNRSLPRSARDADDDSGRRQGPNYVSNQGYNDGNDEAYARMRKRMNPYYRVLERAFKQQKYSELSHKWNDFHFQTDRLSTDGIPATSITDNLVAGFSDYNNFCGNRLKPVGLEFYVNPRNIASLATGVAYLIRLVIFQWKSPTTPPDQDKLLSPNINATTYPWVAPLSVDFKPNMHVLADITYSGTTHWPVSVVGAAVQSFDHFYIYGRDMLPITMRSEGNTEVGQALSNNIYLLAWSSTDATVAPPGGPILELTSNLSFVDDMVAGS